MEMEKKIELLKDLFEVDEIDPATDLDDMSEWDSMTKLSLIAMMDDEFGKTLKSNDIRSFHTIQDILDYMG